MRSLYTRVNQPVPHQAMGASDEFNGLLADRCVYGRLEAQIIV
jgi:hypothetical protein